MPVVISLILAVVTMIFFVRMQSASGTASQLTEDLDKRTKERDQLRDSARSQKDRAEKKSTEIEDLKKRLKAARKRASSAHSQIDDVRAEYKHVDEDKKIRKQALKKADEQLHENNREIAALQKKVQAAEGENKNLRNH